VALSTLFEHRFKFDAQIFNIQDNKNEKVRIFLDTGCFNTLIPKYLAEQSGRSLGFKKTYMLAK
jgi:hypothetical protein